MSKVIKSAQEIQSKIQELADEEEFVEYDEMNGVYFNAAIFTETMNDFVNWLTTP